MGYGEGLRSARWGTTGCGFQPRQGCPPPPLVSTDARGQTGILFFVRFDWTRSLPVGGTGSQDHDLSCFRACAPSGSDARARDGTVVRREKKIPALSPFDPRRRLDVTGVGNCRRAASSGMNRGRRRGRIFHSRIAIDQVVWLTVRLEVRQHAPRRMGERSEVVGKARS